jgi:hypothetical protein
MLTLETKFPQPLFSCFSFSPLIFILLCVVLFFSWLALKEILAHRSPILIEESPRDVTCRINFGERYSIPGRTTHCSRVIESLRFPHYYILVAFLASSWLCSVWDAVLASSWRCSVWDAVLASSWRCSVWDSVLANSRRPQFVLQILKI